MTTMELIERGIGHNCLSDAYDLGRADERAKVIEELKQSAYCRYIGECYANKDRCVSCNDYCVDWSDIEQIKTTK